MTITEAIGQADRLKPNQYTVEQKIRWLSTLDGKVLAEVFQTHEDNPVESFDGYLNSDPGTQLMIPFPYDEDVYVTYLQAQIDRENGEIAKYNQSISLFNSNFMTFESYWNRNHKPLGGARFRY